MDKKLTLDKPAILVVDMLNDFITGALGCENGRAIVPATAHLLEEAKAAGIPVVFCCDAHIKDIDGEFKLWGEHAVAGTHGAEVIPELKADEYGYIVPKRRYSGFFKTNLDLLLGELGVKTVIITGLHAHLCVRHTAADAYQNGYRVILAGDAVTAFTEKDLEAGISDMKSCYGAEVFSNEELISAFKK